MALRPKGVFTRNLRGWKIESGFVATEFIPASGAVYSQAVFANVSAFGQDMYVTDIFMDPGSALNCGVYQQFGAPGVLCAAAKSLRLGGPTPSVNALANASATAPAVQLAQFGAPVGGILFSSGDPIFVVPPGWSIVLLPQAQNVAIACSIWGVMV